ncbi:hexokinase-domain-containing protein [Leucosporidium creatinivorum]|uniref:Phosphotransferase n=1 Tax=Leucosporidium creatinivorum TaxID=106004 RepID=A0A1Y2CGY3_9BASI|nr:hexokinase-domain-containing protein [Leucosporidium creatinivorum]
MSPPYLLPLNNTVELPEKTRAALDSIEQQFDLPTKKLEEIVEQMLWEFGKGLSEQPTKETKDTFMPMIPTYLQHIPSGKETGTFLALDLGGTNLRVCEVTLLGDSKWTMRQQKYKVSQALKMGEVAALFDYIANSVDQFLTEIGTTGDPNEKLYLGFTFSFPVAQTALAKGTLINWTKGFECKNAVGKDVAQLLQDALDRKHIHVKCSALVNDTAGTLMAAAYERGDCLCGGIFGTGTNGAYVEDVAKITKESKTKEELEQAKKDGLDKMVVNTEWGAFDNERVVMPFTIFDSRVDRISINPRKQAFEKMISGMYLGEVTRNVVLHLVDAQVIFKGFSSKSLNAHYGLDTAIMSALEAFSLPNSDSAADPIASIRKCITKDLGIADELVSDADCVAVARVSEIVGTRGCRLSACALAATIKQTGNDKSDKEVKFGLDGSLVEFYPRFDQRVKDALRELLGEDVVKRVVIDLAKDGSGVGAALCAQAAMAMEAKAKH